MMEAEESGEAIFDIVHNARSTRSSRASRSRKSSVSGLETRPNQQKKKIRKLTMNPEVRSFPLIQEADEVNHERAAVHSEKNADEGMDIDIFLELGGPRKCQSYSEQELESPIQVGGRRAEGELDRECGMERWQCE